MPWLLQATIALGLIAACHREPQAPEPRRGTGDKTSKLFRFRPEQGRMSGLTWDDAAEATGLRDRAPLLRRQAVESLGPKPDSEVAQLRGDAVIALLDGRADLALAKLAKARELAPSNAVLASDSAAAHLQRGAAFSDPLDFVRGLIAANHAVHLDPTLPEARFNRALALQRLSLDSEARADWHLYLATERDPRWRSAANRFVAALDRRTQRPSPEKSVEALRLAAVAGDAGALSALAAASPQLARDYAEKTLLVAWAEAGKRESEARQLLAMAGAIGSALAKYRGESMTADTVAGIEAARQSPFGSFDRLVKGFRAYRRGLDLVGQSSFADAEPHFETARRLLARGRSPFAGWATYWLAFCRYQRSDYNGALTLLRPFHQDLDGKRYIALHGTALALEGLIAIIQGDPAASVTAYGGARDDFRKLGESAYAARMAAEAAAGLDYLGRNSEAWQQIYPALLEPATLAVPPTRYSICNLASWLAKGEGELEISLWFHNEMVRIALANRSPLRKALAYRGRAEILGALGRREAARQDVAEGRRELQQIPDPTTRETTDGDLKLVEASLADSPRQAIELLDEVILSFRSSSYHYRLAEALYQRAHAHEAQGRSDETERDLREAIAELELQRDRIPEFEERIAYFDQTREMLDAMVRLQMEQRHQPEMAFRYAEQSKARVLLDWILAHPVDQLLPTGGLPRETATADPSSLCRQLPPGTTVVEYSSLPRSLVIWVLRENGFSARTMPVGTRELAALVQRLRQELDQGRAADARQTSARLYEVLIRPLADHLAPEERIIAIPDGALHILPFAVLWNERTGRYLIQDHVFSIAPSTKVLISSLRRDRELAQPRDPRALLISDPAFDRGLFADLPSLKASTIEASFSRILPGSILLTGQAATRAAFLRQAGEFEIVYFGGHSLINPEHPLLSQMLFAPDPGDAARGVLYSGTLLGQRFGRTRLAILASCSTAAGKVSKTEGVESLARPFLAAGVPSVVASLWNVDDAATAELFGRFLKRLRQSFDPASALRDTQIESLKAGLGPAADPRIWAAFELIGASTEAR